ncbi:hypothetical protein [Streptomyces erythrochromogenes]|uniref:hypothetical protein n=1 Tax=Streptomyces erythrochromogenes TaxID=285574 RepID=UPI0036A0A493
MSETATEQGTTIRQLVEELAEGQPSQTEYGEPAEQARAERASVLGTMPGKEAKAKAPNLLEHRGAPAGLGGRVVGPIPVVLDHATLTPP